MEEKQCLVEATVGSLRAGNAEDAVVNAAALFDIAENTIVSRVCKVRDESYFYLFAGLGVFAVLIKVVVHWVPPAFENRFMFTAYSLFLIALFVFPFIRFSLPWMVRVSYLYRKERFIHRFMDKYNIALEKPVLVKGQVTIPVLLKFVKIPVSNVHVALLFAPVTRLFRVKDPLKEIDRAIKERN